MRTTRSERVRAEQISEAIDHLLSDPEAPLGAADAADAGRMDAARRLAHLPALLGPVDAALEQQVMRRVRLRAGQPQRQPRFRPAWVLGGVVALLLAAMLFTPLGQTAVASFMAVFNLGRTEVRITPVDTPSRLEVTAAVGDAVVRQSLTLEAAQAQVSFVIPQPTYLPAGYQRRSVESYSYPHLPAWVPQPFFVDLVYGDGAEHQLTLRIYPIVLGDQASISGLNLQAAPIRDVQDVAINDQAAVLLQLGSEGSQTSWQEVVWEQGDLILALSATDLSKEELLRVARSVR